MGTIATDQDMQVFIGYFEEPEPGVPDGYTGWYHSAGRFPVTSPSQVFAFEPGQDLVRDDVSGPFTCREDALTDLTAMLT